MTTDDRLDIIIRQNEERIALSCVSRGECRPPGEPASEDEMTADERLEQIERNKEPIFSTG